MLRHSAAHLLAEAVRRLHPGVKVAIGPPIENGFYYDFEFPSPINEADLEAIEAEVQRELAEGRAWEREEISADEARARFAAEGEPYKVELVDTAEGAISLYTQGDFTDLCRGPHLQTSAPIKAFKLTSLAGAYWRGDSSEHAAHADLRDGVLQPEGPRRAPRAARAGDGARPPAARARSSTSSTSTSTRPGSPFWHPKGMAIFNALEDLRRRENARRGYSEVKTPLIYDKALWVTSGHWEKFRENMFLIPIDDEHTYAIKPMNCPGHMLLFGSQLRSYRDLPLRYAEAAPLHRNELAGALHGLTRVRYVTQDDAHIFCSQRAGRRRARRCLEYLRYLYGLFGIEPRAELSTRPDNKLGTDEEWDFTEGKLVEALDRHEIEYFVGEGEGSFYGPKIDLHITDALERSWQLGTIQLDAQMPARFGLTYMGADNREHPVFVVHRAFFGSLERFIGILIEHYGGAFPLWLAPVQVRRAPRERAAPRGCARHRRTQLRAAGLPRRDRRARRDARQADPRQRAREDPGRRRVRRARVGGGARRPDARRGPVDALARGAARGSRGCRRQARVEARRASPDRVGEVGEGPGTPGPTASLRDATLGPAK